MSKTGKRLFNAAREAAAIARGDVKPARCHVPADVDVRAIRLELAMKQDDFAAEFGFTVNQIRDWEQGRTRPIGAVRTYLIIIKNDPHTVRRLLQKYATKRKVAA